MDGDAQAKALRLRLYVSCSIGYRLVAFFLSGGFPSVDAKRFQQEYRGGREQGAEGLVAQNRASDRSNGIGLPFSLRRQEQTNRKTLISRNLKELAYEGLDQVCISCSDGVRDRDARYGGELGGLH